ncbi:peroxin [Coemansia sp. RSA 2675]|uniref:Peroxin n=1 Tax=Coemansia linderi TaxID=2663919 RepID=A0ACC1KCC8_9FUNG|nr:peroxin [Coemansia sp. RSA 2675]KAJ2784654.1 peroxin [Coemansia linderi]
MLDGAWSFVRRHQRKLAITAGIVGGLYYSGRLLVNRVVEMQAVSAKERTSKENIRRRFDQNQRDCLFTIMSLLPELSEQVLREVDVERLITELRTVHRPMVPSPRPGGSSGEAWEGGAWSAGKSPSMSVAAGSEEQGAESPGDGGTSAAGTPGRSMFGEDGDQGAEEPVRRSKVEIWEEIKIQSFARTMIAVYAESLLTMLVHTQLNMVGRSTYLDAVVNKLADPSDGHSSFEGRYESRLSMADEQNFLMLSWWFLNRGWRQLMAQISEATNHCIGQLPLKERVTHRELAALFNGIHLRLRENGLVQSLTAVLLPLGDESVADYLGSNRLAADRVFTPVFVRLLDQMRDVIESADFVYVFNSCVDRLTTQLLESLQESFPEPLPVPRAPMLPTVEGGAAPDLEGVVREFEEFSASPESRVVIVQLLPRIAREGHQILNGVPNHYLENVSASREVQALSAAVYTAEDVTQ